MHSRSSQGTGSSLVITKSRGVRGLADRIHVHHLRLTTVGYLRGSVLSLAILVVTQAQSCYVRYVAQRCRESPRVQVSAIASEAGEKPLQPCRTASGERTRAHGEGEHPRGAAVTSDRHRTTRTPRVSR